MRKVILALHGYNVKDGGAASIDRLRPYAEGGGFEWVDIDYGHTSMGDLNSLNQPLGHALAKMVKAFVGDDVYVVVAGHSNGNVIIANMLEQDPKTVNHFVAINPALEDDWVFPEWVPRVDIFGTPGDFWTSVARFSPVENWGDMSNGYEGSQDFVIYHDMSEDQTQPVDDHSEVFDGAHMPHWGPKMMQVINHRFDVWCASQM